MSMDEQQLWVNLFTRQPGRVHVMGICGAGAAGVAWMLHLYGWKVSGCDQHIPPVLEKFFSKNGIRVIQGHDSGHLAQCDALVYSAAIRANEPELALARAQGLTVLSRGECLAGWVSVVRSVAVCGTHGKTTTSCFATRLLQLTGQNPLWCLGGFTSRLLTSAGPRDASLIDSLNSNQIAVAEADESDGTLACEHPAVLVITNIELDHLDHFHNAEEIEQCFASAVANTREGVAVCADAPRAMRVAAGFKKGPILTFGFSSDAMLRATEVEQSSNGSRFCLTYNGKALGDVLLSVPGDHNILNAMGALAAGMLLGGDIKTLMLALPKACQELPRRRFQWMTEQDAAVRVVVDYAHHPTEILAMLSIARLQQPKRLRLVFQPHRYSRTKRLLMAFVAALSNVSEVVLLPVYAASETVDKGCESYELYAAMRQTNPSQRVLLAETSEEVAQYVRRTAQIGDMVLIVGAGDVERIGHALSNVVPAAVWENPHVACLVTTLPATFELRREQSLARYSWYHVGGEAELLIEPKSIAELVALSIACHVNRVPIRLVGAGADSWFSDLGFPGVVCVLRGEPFEQFMVEGGVVTVGAGVSGVALLNRLEQAGLSGLEFMQGIPGTVGGWAWMNAGAHGQAFWTCVSEVRMVLDDGQIRRVCAQAVTPGYRRVFGLPKGTIVSVKLVLQRDSAEVIRRKRREFEACRVDLAGLRTCGSLFKNPDGLSAGAVLDALGAKQWRIGGAFVTPQHANVIAAGAGCTASDVLALMWRMRDAVAAAQGIELKPEVQGF